MPAAAVIPAPRVYIKVVAVKKLVVGLGDRVQWFLGAHASGVKAVCAFLTWGARVVFVFGRVLPVPLGLL